MHTSENDELNRRYQNLCGAVGHLFISFARLEGALSAILRMHLARRMNGSNYPEIKDVALSSALLGSMRLKTARDTLNRIASVEGMDETRLRFLKSVFEQVGNLESIRDTIAHQQVVPSDFVDLGEWQLIDALTTKDISKPKIFVFDSISVSNAANDLVVASHRLAGSDPKGTIFSSALFDTSPIAWLYKPSMLKLVPHNRQAGI